MLGRRQLRARPRRIADGLCIADLQRRGWGWCATASGWTARRLGPRDVCHGVGINYPRQFVALYADAGTMWLQVGHSVWDVDTIDRVRQTSAGIRRSAYDVMFRDGSRRSVVLRMPARVVAHRCIDPTYDEIDSWADDVMKSLPYVAADGWRSSSESVDVWREQVLPTWRAGFSHSTEPAGT